MPERDFTVAEALGAYVAVLFLLLAVATLLSALYPGGSSLVGIASAQLIIGAVPLGWAALRHRGRVAQALDLRLPTPRALAAGVLCGASVWYLSWRLVAPLGHWLFGNRGELEHLQNTVAQTPLLWVLLAASLAPAVCEELLLRGLVLRALRPRIGAVLAVVISAMLFSALHLNLVQLLPTFVFGLLLGYAALRGGLIVSMIMHALNNAIALLLASGRLDQVGQQLFDAVEVAGPVAALLCSTGLVLLSTRPMRW